jgi:tripartite-type tricarboxylate transporter receptor subunit TctC
MPSTLGSSAKARSNSSPAPDRLAHTTQAEGGAGPEIDRDAGPGGETRHRRSSDSRKADVDHAGLMGCLVLCDGTTAPLRLFGENHYGADPGRLIAGEGRETFMGMTRLLRTVHAAGLVLLIATATATLSARAQGDAANYPNRPIRIVVGFAAGGGNDIFARLIGQKLQENIGQTVIVENKPGAGARLASEYVANQPADGYTLMVSASGAMSIASAVYPKLAYHPTRSFAPLAMIAKFPLILAVPAPSPIKSVKELVDWAKAHPDKANYPSTSPAFTITSELLKLKTGMPGVTIPYKSSNEMMLSIAAEQTLYAFADGPPTMPLVQGGKIRAIAVTGAERSPELPDVPSMAEAGYPEVDVHLWSGVFAPAATPPAIAKRLETELQRVLADAGVQQKLKAMAVTPGGGPADEFRRMIDDDIRKFAEVAKAANLKFDD